MASSALIAEPVDPRKRLNVAPWTVPAHRLSVAEAVELVCGCVNRQTLALGIVVGNDLGFAVHALRFAGALVARQRYIVLRPVRRESESSRISWSRTYPS